MDRNTGAAVMLVLISSIVLMTLVLWGLESVLHLRAIVSSFFKLGRSGDDGDNEPLEDPYDVGLNDEDIL
jgi:hypothetical protein